jgi:3-oxoacyl-[acyl-carrier protein] reductase
MKFHDKTIIITGAGRGLGRAMAGAFAAEGANLVLVSRTASELTDAESDVTGTGAKALPLELDLSLEGSAAEAVEEAVRTFGAIHVLVNNAATTGPPSLIAETDPNEWARTMELNLNAPQRLCLAAIPHMLEGGCIINITSGLADIVMPMFGAYSVSKAGLNHMTRIMAEELRGHGIRVNGMDPGIMDTSMQEHIRGLGPEVLGKALHNQFVLFKEEDHLLDPAEVAPLALFLASDDAAEISGEVGSASEYEMYGYGLEDPGEQE